MANNLNMNQTVLRMTISMRELHSSLGIDLEKASKADSTPEARAYLRNASLTCKAILQLCDATEVLPDT